MHSVKFLNIKNRSRLMEKVKNKSETTAIVLGILLGMKIVEIKKGAGQKT